MPWIAYKSTCVTIVDHYAKNTKVLTAHYEMINYVVHSRIMTRETAKPMHMPAF